MVFETVFYIVLVMVAFTSWGGMYQCHPLLGGTGLFFAQLVKLEDITEDVIRRFGEVGASLCSGLTRPPHTQCTEVSPSGALRLGAFFRQSSPSSEVAYSP
jgi:hypothetical protein